MQKKDQGQKNFLIYASLPWHYKWHFYVLARLNAHPDWFLENLQLASVLPVLIHMSFSVYHPKTYKEMEDIYFIKYEERDSFSIYRDYNQSKYNGTDSFSWIVIYFFYFHTILRPSWLVGFLDSLLSRLHRFRAYDFLMHSNEIK